MNLKKTSLLVSVLMQEGENSDVEWLNGKYSVKEEKRHFGNPCQILNKEIDTAFMSGLQVFSLA